MMTVNDFWDVLGGILLLALVATILTKKNTAQDVTSLGKAFSDALKVAEAG